MKVKETFKQLSFNNAMNEFLESEKELQENINVLQSNGLATDKESLLKYIALNEDTFKEMVTQMCKEYLARIGAVIPQERKRIIASYNEFAAEVYPVIKSMQWKVSRFQIQFVEVDGVVSVDKSATEQALREKFTEKYNLDKVDEYWEQVLKVTKALKELKEWESKNPVCSSFCNKVYTYINEEVEQLNELGTPCPPRETDSFTFVQNPDKTQFEQMTYRGFILPKKG